MDPPFGPPHDKCGGGHHNLCTLFVYEGSNIKLEGVNGNIYTKDVNVVVGGQG